MSHHASSLSRPLRSPRRSRRCYSPQLMARLLVLAAIWITAVLSLLRKEREELNLLRGMLPICASGKTCYVKISDGRDGILIHPRRRSVEGFLPPHDILPAILLFKVLYHSPFSYPGSRTAGEGSEISLWKSHHRRKFLVSA